MRLNRVVKVLCCFVCLSCHFAYGQDLANLYAQGNVRLNTWISHAGTTVAVNEQVTVNIEVLTDTWFTKGTRVHRFDVENAIVLSNQASSVNSTERIDGKVYSKQLWEVVLYPLSSGEFYIPPITVEMTVKGLHSSTQKKHSHGFLTTQPLTFKASRPMPEMTSTYDWLTGQDVQILEEWQWIKSGDKATNLKSSDFAVTSPLHVGDALVRTVTTTANMTHAMLLPDLISSPEEDSLHHKVEQPLGNFVTFYRHQNHDTDTQVRGEYRTKKVETATYIAKKEGTLIFPEKTVYWWDPESQQKKEWVLSGKEWQVEHTFASFITLYKYAIFTILVGITLLILMIRKVAAYYRSKPLPGEVALLLAIKRLQLPSYETSLYRLILKRHHQKLMRLNQSNSVELQIENRYFLEPQRVETPSRLKFFVFAVKKIWLTKGK